MDIRQGLATGNNQKYLKKTEDVNPDDICFDAQNTEDFFAKGKTYAPYNKGGAYRKWYGNLNYVIRFDKKSVTELSKQGNRLPSKIYYFRQCLTWTLVSSKGHFGARISENSVFDVGGSCGFPKQEKDIFVLLGYLCSAAATYYLNAQNPTLNCQVGDLKNLPYIPPPEKERARIETLVKENIEIAKRDWHALEIPPKSAIENVKKMQYNEEELNRIFLSLYGLDGEISPRVEERLITLKHKGAKQTERKS
jgi:hypothetical protein